MSIHKIHQTESDEYLFSCQCVCEYNFDHLYMQVLFEKWSSQLLHLILRGIGIPSQRYTGRLKNGHLKINHWLFKNVNQKNIQLEWRTFWGATMLALLGCEFSLCSKHNISHSVTHNRFSFFEMWVKTWRGGWGPMTDCDRVDWGPMKSRTCSQGKMRPK